MAKKIWLEKGTEYLITYLMNHWSYEDDWPHSRILVPIFVLVFDITYTTYTTSEMAEIAVFV